jgi:hypothetical protein
VHVAPWQTPFTHASPATHGAHATPPVPQSLTVLPAWHLPAPSQQPFGHVEALHVDGWHEPMVQVSPAGHAVHARPPIPHAPVVLPGSQVPALLQQPVGQVAGLHVGWQLWAVHASPGGHAVQLPPPLPHAIVVVPVSQKPSASQHPLGQVAGLHVGPLHTPPEQVSPGGHGRQAFPPVPQARVLVPGSQFPKLSQQPFGQVIALQVAPWQAPPLHVSPAGHTLHALPPFPHAIVLVPGWQTPAALQQPVGQVEALQGGA